MNLLAATATPGHALTVAILSLALTAAYLTRCLCSPFARCRRCRGAGLLRPRLGRVARPCNDCDSTGLRLRLGRRLINRIHRQHDAATRPRRRPGRFR